MDYFNYTFIIMNEKTTTYYFYFLSANSRTYCPEIPTLQWVLLHKTVWDLKIPHDIKPSSDGNVFLFNDFASSAQESSYDPDERLNKGTPKLQLLLLQYLRTVPEPQRKPLPVHLI